MDELDLHSLQEQRYQAQVRQQELLRALLRDKPSQAEAKGQEVLRALLRDKPRIQHRDMYPLIERPAGAVRRAATISGTAGAEEMSALTAALEETEVIPVGERDLREIQEQKYLAKARQYELLQRLDRLVTDTDSATRKVKASLQELGFGALRREEPTPALFSLEDYVRVCCN